MSVWNNRLRMATAPKSLKVTDTMRRYSSGPVPRIRGERVWNTARKTSHSTAIRIETAQ